jgi:hypothetical protein
MINNLTAEEEFFVESFYNVRCLVETTFSKGTPRNWNDGKKCIRLRTYQRPFLGFDSAIEDDDRLTELENFRRRIKLGSRIIVCARKIGKTFIALVANILVKLLHYKDKEMTMCSYDEKHVNKVLDAVKEFFVYHNFYKSCKQTTRGSPEYLIETKNGNKLFGINETVKGKSPGENWWGHHTFINFQDEIQAETEVAYSHKIDATSDFGVMEILCGIPLITKVSPLGRIIRDRTLRKSIIRLPQYVSYLWDDITKEKRIRDYGGQESAGYRINVAADLIEGAMGAFDMDRVKLNYNKKRTIKRFEITKKDFKIFKSLLIIEPIINADKVYVVSDIGDTAATEINVIAKINNKYHLIYNITTYKLSLTQELPDVIEYIFRTVKANFLSVDCTIMGKPVYEILSERLNEIIRDEKGIITKFIRRVFWCAFNEDIVTGFERDEKGKIVRDGKGNITEKKEPTLVFAVRRLNELFYDKKFDIPDDDYKFENQFASYVSIISGNKILYDSTMTEDHYVQTFEVFAILEWLTEQLPVLSVDDKFKKPGLGAY